MSSSPPAKTHPLKRILSKQAFKSRTSLDLARTKEDALEVEGSATPASGIARTLTEVDENRLQEAELATAAVPEESASPAAVEGKKKKRMSMGGKIKWFGGVEKKEKVKPATAAAPVAFRTALKPTLEVTDATKQGNGDAAGTTGPPQEQVVKRIRDLLTAAPPFYPTTNALGDQALRLFQSSDSHPIDEIQGTKLFSLLSDPTVMSGPDGQPSVWNALDRVSFSFADNMNAVAASSTARVATAGVTHPDNSIMLCAPLIIDENTKVELAEYRLVQVPLDRFDEDASAIRAAGWWPPWEWGKPAPTTPPPTKEVRVWIPSSDKISVQFAWWGYRIWIPPPMIKVLDDKTLDIAKKAHIISTALQWILDHVPSGLPLELMAVVVVLKAIAPIIGYIGAFVSWSWDAIKSFDKGQGVVLSATWLLPIALIPGSWDFVPPTTPASPAPAPTPPTPAPVLEKPVENNPISTPALPPDIPVNAGNGPDPVLVIPNKDGDYTAPPASTASTS